MDAFAVDKVQRSPTKRVADVNVLGRPGIGTAWTYAIIALGLGFGVLVGLYFPTVTSAVHLWNTSSAYNYAYLILPTSLWLIWIDRHQLAATHPEPTFWGAAVAAAFSLAWLAGDLLDINEARHIAFVGMMLGLALGVLGWRIAKFLAFPLLYLWFLVPTGSFLLEPLQRLSHAANVALLKLSGVPLYAEGFLIQVPAGSFLVEPGCAGLNFFLVALALSLLYGKLTYDSMRARLTCVVVALAASILANIIRIYLIIGLAQATDRRIDITADHLLYGWGFFSVVMLLMMWLGTRIQATPPRPRVLAPASTALAPGRVLAVTCALGVAIALSPVWAANSSGRTALETQLRALIGRLGFSGAGATDHQNGA